MTVQRILAAAKFSNAPITVENINWGDSQREVLKRNSFTSTFPYLHTPNGILSESYAIIQYLVNNYNQKLLGENDWEKAQVDQWVEFAQLELSRFSKDLVYPILGFTEYNKEKSTQALKEIKEWIKILDNHLIGKNYIVGNSYTLADLELFLILKNYFQFFFVEEIRKILFPNVTSWLIILASHDNMLSTYGRTLLCKAPQNAYLKVVKKEAAIKNESEKKPEKKEKENEEEEETKNKKANPLDLLPASSFILDDFKKEFMNSKDRVAVMCEFWKKFDSNGFSFWSFKYDRLPSEGKVLFRSKNSLSFFLQKLDGFRKYCFAVHGIYGVEGDYDIKGVWMWRGTELPEEVIYFC